MKARFGLVLLVLTTISSAQMGVKPTNNVSSILGVANATASKSNRNVIILFRKENCPWCLKMKLALGNSLKIWRKYFVLVTLHVNEDADTRKLETPGGAKLYESAGGKGQGVPYMAIFNPKGKLLSNSKTKVAPHNVGFPVAPEEVDTFLAMLKTGASKMSAAELKQIRTEIEKVGQQKN